MTHPEDECCPLSVEAWRALTQIEKDVQDLALEEYKNCNRVFPKKRTPKADFTIDAWDILLSIFTVVLFIFPGILPFSKGSYILAILLLLVLIIRKVAGR